MHLDAPLRNFPLADVAGEARRLESMGFGALWSFETSRDPFLPLLQVALATERIRLGTNIAVAFARTENDKGTSLSNAERARYLKSYRECCALTKSDLRREADRLYDKNASTVIALSHPGP